LISIRLGTTVRTSGDRNGKTDREREPENAGGTGGEFWELGCYQVFFSESVGSAEIKATFNNFTQYM
jgi:hypothetical protein